MSVQRTSFFDIWNNIARLPQSLLERISIRKRNRKRNMRERQRAQEAQVPILQQVMQVIPIIEQAIPIIERLIPITEQLFKNKASMETTKLSEGKTPKKSAVKTLKKSKKKKTNADNNFVAKTQRKLLPKNSVATPRLNQ